MQKVEGSSPFIRFRKAPQTEAFHVGPPGDGEGSKTPGRDFCLPGVLLMR
jgi:hypothetical protein